MTFFNFFTTDAPTAEPVIVDVSAYGTEEKPCISALNRYCADLQYWLHMLYTEPELDYDTIFVVEDELEYWTSEFTVFLPN